MSAKNPSPKELLTASQTLERLLQSEDKERLKHEALYVKLIITSWNRRYDYLATTLTQRYDAYTLRQLKVRAYDPENYRYQLTHPLKKPAP